MACERIKRQMVEPKYSNGDEVKCNITGVKGVITAVSLYRNGCIRYMIQPQKLKNGRPDEVMHFDENDIDLIKSAKIKATPARFTAGPQNNNPTR